MLTVPYWTLEDEQRKETAVRMVKKQATGFGEIVVSDWSLMIGKRSGAEAPLNGGKGGVQEVPFFFTMGAPWIIDTSKVKAAIRDATATMRENRFGATRFSVLLGLNLVSKAQTKGLNEVFISDPPNVRRATFLDQLQLYATKMDWLFGDDGLQFYQWDP
ncbi:hypothetical protein PIB30_029947, partial [Stylosanthes scabra]|nr:hypothetical protein [Stylosanthes scabra]